VPDEDVLMEVRHCESSHHRVHVLDVELGSQSTRQASGHPANGLCFVVAQPVEGGDVSLGLDEDVAEGSGRSVCDVEQLV